MPKLKQSTFMPRGPLTDQEFADVLAVIGPAVPDGRADHLRTSVDEILLSMGRPVPADTPHLDRDQIHALVKAFDSVLDLLPGESEPEEQAQLVAQDLWFAEISEEPRDQSDPVLAEFLRLYPRVKVSAPYKWEKFEGDPSDGKPFEVLEGEFDPHEAFAMIMALWQNRVRPFWDELQQYIALTRRYRKLAVSALEMAEKKIGTDPETKDKESSRI
jgi:hypothetical protein